MRLKVTILAVLAAVLTASTAIAAPPAGKGKPVTGEGCKPMVTVVLKGALTGVSATSLDMTVTRSNRWGRAWATAGSATLTVTTDKTKVRRNGKTTGLVATDRVLVQARVCKAELANEAMPPLTAVRVVAHPVKA